LLEEVQDILDEIKMVQSVIDDQIKVLESSEIQDFFFGRKGSFSDRRDGFREPRKILYGTRENFDAMNSLTRAVEEGVSRAILELLIQLTWISLTICLILNRNRPTYGKLEVLEKGRRKQQSKARYLSVS
jgi:hypothetical protein